MIYLWKRVVPIVSPDNIYLDDSNSFTLDCTRENGTNRLVSRKDPINYSVEDEIKKLASYFKKEGIKDIVFYDDVIYSGKVFLKLDELFQKENIKIVGVRALITSSEFLKENQFRFKDGIKTRYILGKNTIDQVCERDFYYGIVQSGILIRENNILKKSPYFEPFGYPTERASIPKEYSKEFSTSCIDRSIDLWEEIERLSKREINKEELPEEIIGDNGRIVNILKRGKIKCYK